MTVQYRELYQTWALRLSIITAFVVLLLSWINEIKLFDLIVRAGVSFGVMYFLMIGTLNLFERAAPQEPEDDQTDAALECGGTIDFSVGDDNPTDLEGHDNGFPGQVNRDFMAGLPDSQKQAEIVKRMGWQ